MLKAVELEEVEWIPAADGGRPELKMTGRKETLDVDLVFLAMGFVHPEQEGLLKELELAVDSRKNIAVNADYRTASNKIFACGDAVSGASLVVRAIAAGRKTAEAIDRGIEK
ncbi:Glutamate synthase [NADPH] small chain [Bacteroidales bacterium Barb6]|nr:Glutamate synthase [NADPH] small chain [Bacteroidales bacterium Barb6]OAV74894.1 Glutamate synthase [NADPH] small chain [Bacteroidales bacterium Barb7]